VIEAKSVRTASFNGGIESLLLGFDFELYNCVPMPEVVGQETPPVVRFGDYDLDRERGILFRGGVALKLQPQPLRALAFLIDHAPEIVSREALADHIWGDGVHVEVEQSLNFCIRQIRQVLNDRPANPKFVETLPRQGYRFIGRVVREAEACGLNVMEVSLGQQGEPNESEREMATVGAVQPAADKKSPGLSRRSFVFGAGVTAVAGGGLWVHDMLRRPRVGVINVSVPIPQSVGAADPGRLLGPPAVAPDGSALVVSLQTSTGNQLYIRPLKANQLIPMQGTQGGSAPFWSPDSQSIAFFAEGKLKRISAAGGSVLVLCEAQKPRGGSWGSRGTIIFGLNTMALFQVAESGGPVTAATRLDTAAGENSHRLPVFLPDGIRYLYLARNDNPDLRGIYLDSLSHNVERKRILVTDGGVALGRDPENDNYFLLSEQAGGIIAQRFDMRRGELIGAAHRVTDRAGMLSASNTGVLVIRTEQVAGGLVWRDRDGKTTGAMGKATEFWAVALSPNGRFVAATKHESTSGRFTVLEATLPDGSFEIFSDADHATSVMWSSDNNTVYYSDIRQWKLFRRRLNPRGAEEMVCELPGETAVSDVSPDGRFAVGELAMMSAHAKAAWIDLQVDGKVGVWHLLGSSDAIGPLPRFSPDGRWLALSSNQNGTSEIYVIDFPAGLQRHRVSTDGGHGPQWRGDGKELFYVSEGGDMMAASISTEGGLRIGVPDRLFAANLRVGSEGALYDVTEDGQRFILMEAGNGSDESNIEMLLNWPDLLQ
jgi:DNA-binding winged helix-turn-helix (wHTH) protein